MLDKGESRWHISELVQHYSISPLLWGVERVSDKGGKEEEGRKRRKKLVGKEGGRRDTEIGKEERGERRQKEVG